MPRSSSRALLPWPDQPFVLAVARRRAPALAFGTFFTPGMTLLSNVAEERGLHFGYAFALINLAWAPGQTLGAAGGGALAHLTRRRRSVPALSGVCALTLAPVGGAHRSDASVRPCRRCSWRTAARSRCASSAPRASSASARSPSSRPTTRGSLHARSADQTVEIGSYLDAEEHIRAAARERRRRGPSRLRLPRRERRLRRGRRGGGLDVGRAAAGRAARAAATSSRRSGSRRRRACRPCPRPDDAAADREGGGGRRRPRHARRARARPSSTTRSQAARREAQAGFRRRPRLPRALPRAAAPRRDPAARRRARHRALARRARVLGAAAPPEGARGVAVARARPRRCARG